MEEGTEKATRTFKMAAVSAALVAVGMTSNEAFATRKTRVQLTCEQIQKNGQNGTLENTLPQYSEHFYIVAKFNSCLNTLLTPPYTYLRTSSTGSGLVSRNKEGTQVVLAQFPDEGQDLTAFGLIPSALKSIALPNDIQEWPTTALDGCTALEQITVFGEPAKEATIELSVGHGLQKLTNLKSIHLPSTLKSTANGVVTSDGSANIFSRALQSVSFRDSSLLQTIGNVSFSYCEKLASLDFSRCASLTGIGGCAFEVCTRLTSVNLSGCSSLQKLASYAFSSCKIVSVCLSGCSSLQSIDDHAFYSCSNLTVLDLSGCSSLQSTGGLAFTACSNLLSLDFSECSSFKDIGGYAFYNCSRLQNVIFPASLTTVGDYAFAGTTLTKVYWRGSGSAANIGGAAFPSGVQHVYNYNPG